MGHAWLRSCYICCLGSSLAIMKKEAKYLPIIGWSTWFSDYLFLERNWAKDENILKAGFKRLEVSYDILVGFFSLKELVSLRRSSKLLKITPLAEAYRLLEMS